MKNIKLIKTYIKFILRQYVALLFYIFKKLLIFFI